MYLITASLLNSWQWLLNLPNYIENDEERYKNALADFQRVLNRQPSPFNQYIERGFAFEKWCEENLEETKGGIYQAVEKKVMGDYLLYGRLDCLKAGVIYDYKYSSRFEYGKFYDNYQTPMYLELVPEALKMVYVVTNTEVFNKDDIFYEQYTREEIKDKEPILVTIEYFMKWIKDNGYSMEKWLTL